MQPNTTVVKSMGDLGGTKVAMQFDVNSIEHIMKVLTDLYSDPIGAIIREYSTNALDSHKAVGQTRPVEVTLPTMFDASFKVKDFGLGLSVDDITNIYSQYGASTKRGTNDQTGMLGLGCKSGLTYSDQFVVNSVKGGVKVSVVVSRTESGAGIMEILDTVYTNYPNSVEIVIPTKAGDHRTFENKAAEFYKYWPKGSVLVNGGEPERFDASNAVKITDSIYLVNNVESHKIVMGDVAYPVDFDKIAFKNASRQRYNYSNWGLIAFVGMGEVNFTPSREQLHMTRLTTSTLANIGEEFDKNIVARIESEISNATDFQDAWKKFNDWTKPLNIKVTAQYQGHEIKNQYQVPGVVVSPGRRNRLHNANGEVFEYGTITRLFISGMKGVTSGSQRGIISKWLEEKGHNVKSYILVEEVVSNPFLANHIHTDWETIKSETKHTRSKEYRASAGTYPITIPGASYTTDQILPESDKIVYLRKADGIEISSVAKALPEYYVIYIYENRLAKLNRDFPEVKPYRTVIRDELVKKVTKQNKYDALQQSGHIDMINMFSSWDDTQINDPKIVKTIMDCREAKKSEWASKNHKIVTLASNLNVSIVDYLATDKCDDPKKALDGYPLIAGYLSYYGNVGNLNNMDKVHIYSYINSIYGGK